MSPAKRTTKRTAKRTTRRMTAKRITRAARKPAAPPRLNEHFRDVNVVWYNVTDWAGARKFYHETIGLPIAAEIPGVDWIEFGLPNQTHVALNLWRGPEPMPPTNGGATVTFGCDDVRGTIAKLKAKGVRCDEVDEIPGMVILCSFYDPEGNRLQIAETPK